LVASLRLHAAESCITLHGRANLYGGDLQLRVWHIGTHHEYTPDDATWPTVIDWLTAGVPKAERKNYAIPASSVFLYADFVVCPIEPFKQGSVQQAKILSAVKRHYVRLDQR
jgi:hypothetical protein